MNKSQAIEKLNEIERKARQWKNDRGFLSNVAIDCMSAISWVHDNMDKIIARKEIVDWDDMFGSQGEVMQIAYYLQN